MASRRIQWVVEAEHNDAYEVSEISFTLKFPQLVQGREEAKKALVYGMREYLKGQDE